MLPEASGRVVLEFAGCEESEYLLCVAQNAQVVLFALARRSWARLARFWRLHRSRGTSELRLKIGSIKLVSEWMNALQLRCFYISVVVQIVTVVVSNAFHLQDGRTHLVDHEQLQEHSKYNAITHSVTIFYTRIQSDLLQQRVHVARCTSVLQTDKTLLGARTDRGQMLPLKNRRAELCIQQRQNIAPQCCINVFKLKIERMCLCLTRVVHVGEFFRQTAQVGERVGAESDEQFVRGHLRQVRADRCHLLRREVAGGLAHA